MNNLSQPIMEPGCIEFYAHQGQAFVFIDGEKMPVADAPVKVHKMIRRDLEHHPGALHALEQMNITDPIDQHLQYTMCMHGELNSQPDFIKFQPNTTDQEFTQLICGVQHCAHRGVLCHKIHGQYGNLTDRESEIVRHIARGAHPQEIADSFGTSINTVRNQIETIKSKIGVDSLAGIAIYGTQNRF